ncbi:hypothetical protein Tco_0377886 [Tanacetum coccineum]
MRELRRKIFIGTDDEDAYEHVRMVLEIVDLFHFPGVTHDAIMLRVFSNNTQGTSLEMERQTSSRKLEEIRNFKQERDETLYYAWERYNDLLYQCPLHDLDCQQKEIHNEEAQEDEGDMYVGWDITNKDVERLRQFLTPTIHTLPNLEPIVPSCIPLGLVHDKDKIVREKKQDYDIPLNDSVMQPLTPQTIHITQPDYDYVAPATNSMSNKQLNKFEEEFSHITEVAEKEYDDLVIKHMIDPGARRHLSRTARLIIMWFEDSILEEVDSEARDKLWDEITVKSAAAKMARSKSVYQHTMGRGGYALAKEKMEKRSYARRWNQLDNERRETVQEKKTITKPEIMSNPDVTNRGNVLLTLKESVLACTRGAFSINDNSIDTTKISAYEEGGTTVVGCENDASIQKSNGLATLEKEMETRATPPSTIQMNVENKTAPKLHTKRKNIYVSSDEMQRQAKKKSLQKSLNY